MHTRYVLRIAALVAGILVCLGLALGACMAKRSDTSSLVQRPNGETADHNAPENSRMDKALDRADAGAAHAQPRRRTMKRNAMPKSRTGMVGQMHLEGGE